jgi:hypothetical protein
MISIVCASQDNSTSYSPPNMILYFNYVSLFLFRAFCFVGCSSNTSFTVLDMSHLLRVPQNSQARRSNEKKQTESNVPRTTAGRRSSCLDGVLFMI